MSNDRECQLRSRDGHPKSKPKSSIRRHAHTHAFPPTSTTDHDPRRGSHLPVPRPIARLRRLQLRRCPIQRPQIRHLLNLYQRPRV
ncbi:hypothetical protein BCR44DRAFT_1453496, partial [Catenaria anguillulae PL171]